ncbi:TldD/PmbA family protein [Candidatus Bathyarchaeota archaeon]|nr:TldD/PmbA family protein [Candidatus Bathyarchaeota archaeon]RJS70114.1 MAG: TldD/PmbA family protein [Candidatus Bathyarchaeota archaeon]RLI20950.1 MAG: TldD/PmbA family protein [Candidatus Bathyarchaeota archaeon]
MKDFLTKVTDLAVQKFGAEYAEIRAQKLFKTMLTVKDGRIEAAKQGIENGVALRVLVNGAWGFASVGTFDIETLTSAISDACRMAKTASLKLKTPIKLVETKTVEDKISVKPKKNPAEISVEDKIDTALAVNNTVRGYDKRVKSCTIDYLDLTGTNYFLNNEGTYIEQDKLYVWSRILATASEANVLTFSREEIGSTAGYEVFDVETPEIVGKRAAKRAVEQLKAKPPRGGNFPAVLGPNVVGVFVHEAFGHLAEADLTLSGSVLLGKLGKKIASDVVTFYDDGTIEGAFGSFKYDDEGVPTQKTLLVKDGIVVGLMHNRETAHKFDAKPTGNARAEDFRFEPIIRMRNTFMEPKDHSFEELLEDIKFGYYLKSFRGGQANLDGTFQVGIQEAYEITNGELGDPVRNASISGNTLETLLKVDAVGKDFELWPGRCGKGQTAFIGDGGPHVRVKEVLIGGSA